MHIQSAGHRSDVSFRAAIDHSRVIRDGVEVRDLQAIEELEELAPGRFELVNAESRTIYHADLLLFDYLRQFQLTVRGMLNGQKEIDLVGADYFSGHLTFTNTTKHVRVADGHTGKEVFRMPPQELYGIVTDFYQVWLRSDFVSAYPHIVESAAYKLAIKNCTAGPQ